MAKDYYSILGVNKDASQAEIKAAYRKLAHKFHPDKNPGDAFFEQMFRDLKDAYETLSDEVRRAQYNENSQDEKPDHESKKSRDQPHEPNSNELVSSIISNLMQMGNQVENASEDQVDINVISKYLNNILIGDILNLYQFISDSQKRNLIFTVVPLLRFFEQRQKNKYITQLVWIAGSDNALIQEIDRRTKYKTSKQQVRSTASFLKRNWRLVGFLIVIVVVYLTSIDGDNSYISQPSKPIIANSGLATESTLDNYGSAKEDKNEHVKEEQKLPEQSKLQKLYNILEEGGMMVGDFDAFEEELRNNPKKLERLRITLIEGGMENVPETAEAFRRTLGLPHKKVAQLRKWKGNYLETGDSPYDHYFGKGVYDKSLQNRVKIHNGQGTDAVVCLTQYYSPHRTIRNEYIRAGESFEITSVPNGIYYLKSFYGNDWNPDTLFMESVRGFFEAEAGFSKSDDYSDLLQIEQDGYQYSIIEVTLYPVVGGNMESEPINADEFFK